MQWDWFTNIFGYFYNFFMGIYQALSVPANALTTPWEFYNPYLNVTIHGGIPEIFSDTLKTIGDTLVNWWAKPILSLVGLDISAPVWAVILSYLPLIILVVFLVRIVLKSVT